MNSDLIDVVLPVYNGAKTIASSVSSILNQNHRNICVHVVDDGSTDRTPEILAELARGDRRLVIHRQENSGIVDALNAGLSHCQADLIARHDADDLAYPTRFETQLAYLKAHPDCVAVGSEVRHIDAEGRPTGSFGRVKSPEDADPFWVPSKEPYMIHPFLMARRDAIVAVGGYRYVHHAEDTDLYWRLRSQGRLHNLSDVLGDYRLHGESISGSSLKNSRIMAISSQLAALSARRRAESKPDLVFDKTLIVQLRARESLADLVQVVTQRLFEDELAYFKISVAAKIMESAAYRPIELEMADCRFIHASFDFRKVGLSRDNLRSLRRQVAGTAARLASKSMFDEARRLLQPQFYLPFLVRYGLRVGMPTKWRELLRMKLRNAEVTK